MWCVNRDQYLRSSWDHFTLSISSFLQCFAERLETNGRREPHKRSTSWLKSEGARRLYGSHARLNGLASWVTADPCEALNQSTGGKSVGKPSPASTCTTHNQARRPRPQCLSCDFDVHEYERFFLTCSDMPTFCPHLFPLLSAWGKSGVAAWFFSCNDSLTFSSF